jgi:glycerol-3-phosphate acyltransferase PlsX
MWLLRWSSGSEKLKGLKMAVVLDAMGGDYAPHEVVQGALKAAKEDGLEIILTGPQSVLEPLCAGVSNISVVDAPEIIEMAESPAEAFRRKPDSSVVRGLKIAKERGIPFVSAGNTGACMAGAMFVFGRLPGVKRPPIASVFPSIGGGTTVVLDVGANVDCDSDNLLSFAVMGSAYFGALFGKENPTVGLLSNGEESKKGNALVLETHQKLLNSGLNFIGNVEGFDVLTGRCDVIVMDGFVGNVLLKTTEGVARACKKMLGMAIAGAGLEPQKAATLASGLSALDPDRSEHSGAQLLGINGYCTIVHGSAKAATIRSALLMSERIGGTDILGRISAGVDGEAK